MPQAETATINAATPDPGARLAIVVLGLLTGAGLFLLQRAAALDSPLLLTVLYTLLIAVPLLLALLLRRLREGYAWRVGLVYALLLLPLAIHTGGALLAEQNYAGNEGINFRYCLSLLVASFILVPFVQARRAWPPHYPTLFEQAWNNALTLVVALVFTLASWLILLLWQALFAMIGIGFFTRLFERPEFCYPASGLFAGAGLMLGRSQAGAIRVILNVCLLLGRVLFVPVAVLALLFLATLAGGNIGRLWDTRHASALILTLVFAVVALLNAVYQDGIRANAPARPLRLLAGAVLLTLPVYTGIAAYAMTLRIAQHGWTEDRLWGCLVCLVATLHALSYAAAVLQRREAWLALVGPANAWIALFTAVLLLATQSPLLDLRGIAVHAQVERALAPGGDPGRLDLAYLRFEAGQPGDAALRGLAQDQRSAAYPQLRADAARMLAQKGRYDSVPMLVAVDASTFTVRPAGTPVPEGLLTLLSNRGFGATDPWVFETRSCVDHPGQCLLLNVDLGPAARSAWVEVGLCGSCRAPVFGEGPDGWKLRGVINGGGADGSSLAALRDGRYSTQVSPWFDLVVGDGRRYRVVPEN